MPEPSPRAPASEAEAASTLSVILPTLDEAAAIQRAVSRCLQEADEVVVVDGGSRDETRRLAAAAGARVLTAPLGRGSQLLEGARAAKGEILLFLHADTELPRGAGAAVRRALRKGAVGGGFTLRWDARGWAYRFGERWINLRTRWSRAPLGDQAQFATRRAYEAAGGHPPWPILEDLRLIRRLRRVGRLAVLEPPVVTSARRFQRFGILRTLAVNWTIFLLFFVGVPPERLARLYAPPRSGAGGPREATSREPA